MNMENTDKKILKALLQLASVLLIWGWIFYGIYHHEFLLVGAVISGGMGVTITSALKEESNK